MNEIIYPRSPRETMDGWNYLPRYVDKIRLHLAGKLHSDYRKILAKVLTDCGSKPPVLRTNNSSRS